MTQSFITIRHQVWACLFIFIIGCLICDQGEIYGSPRLITDNRVENLNGHPSIGRGYNLHSNTLQSVCFSKVEKTRPTFDLSYEMDEITGAFFNEVPEIGKNRLGNVNIHFFVKKYFKQREVESRNTYQLKNILVRLVIQNYYYALDETRSVLSQSAKELLANREFVTFFNSCGQHYVRSVGSFSSYLALLQYRLTGEKEVDTVFANRLEKGLFNFSGDNTVAQTFTKDAEARGMRVYVQAIGLSKGKLVNLIPVDINQFRLTVQDTVKLMQDPDAGLVRYLEVSPWVENPELTNLLTARMEAGSEQFITLQRLEANSGVITEINRISNEQIEQFYIASMCEKILFEKYMDKTNRKFYENITGQTEKSPSVLFLSDIIEQKTLSYDMEKTKFYNLANIAKENVYISLREYIEYFAKNPPNKLFDENREYLYGDGKKPGATHCIDELYKQGLDKIDYRTIPSCVSALKHIKSQSFFLSQYCLPKPAKLVFKGMDTGDKATVDEKRPVTHEVDQSSVFGAQDDLGGTSISPEDQSTPIMSLDQLGPVRESGGEPVESGAQPTSLDDIRDSGRVDSSEIWLDDVLTSLDEESPQVEQELDTFQPESIIEAPIEEDDDDESYLYLDGGDLKIESVNDVEIPEDLDSVDPTKRKKDTPVVEKNEILILEETEIPETSQDEVVSEELTDLSQYDFEDSDVEVPDSEILQLEDVE